MRTFLGIGECMVELAPAGPDLFRQGFAGDVFNTLWYARRALGPDWRVEFFTGLGADRLSDGLVAFAAAAGISCDMSPRVPGRSLGLYMIHLTRGERSFSYWRDTSAARLMLADPERIAARIAAADVVYLSGITLAILPPADAAALIDLVGTARAAGKLIAFDPNIRPRLWDSAQRMRDTVSRAATAATVILPSFDDEAAAFGDPSPAATADRYAALGCGHVVVKNGAAAVLTLIDGRRADHPVAPVARIVDTTAAGDSFNAAYLAEFLCSGDTAQAVRAGQARAARTIATSGALVDGDDDRPMTGGRE
jgi:2-dehydro-3-deoxygluconokinase